MKSFNLYKHVSCILKVFFNRSFARSPRRERAPAAVSGMAASPYERIILAARSVC